MKLQTYSKGCGSDPDPDPFYLKVVSGVGSVFIYEKRSDPDPVSGSSSNNLLELSISYLFLIDRKNILIVNYIMSNPVPNYGCFFRVRFGSNVFS